MRENSAGNPMIKTDKLSRPLFFRVREMISTGLVWGLLTVGLFQDSHFLKPRIYGLTAACDHRGVQIWDMASRESIITIIGSFDPTLWWYQPDTQILTGHSLQDNTAHENILTLPLHDTRTTVEHWPGIRHQTINSQYCLELASVLLITKPK